VVWDGRIFFFVLNSSGDSVYCPPTDKEKGRRCEKRTRIKNIPTRTPLQTFLLRRGSSIEKKMSARGDAGVVSIDACDGGELKLVCDTAKGRDWVVKGRITSEQHAKNLLGQEDARSGGISEAQTGTLWC